MFVNIKRLGVGSLAFAEALLDEARVAVVPGVAFGRDGCIRLSYATDLTTIEEGCARIHQFVLEKFGPQS